MADSRKRDREEEDDHDDDGELQHMTGTSRGEPAHSLSSLSRRVAEICRARGRTTYNEVADELVLEILRTTRPSSEEKNIRRRVYDAFNVLIAVGVIEKDGKKEVMWKGLASVYGSSQLQSSEEISDELREARLENERRLQAVQTKQLELQGLLDSHKVISHLVETNPARGDSEESSGTGIPLHIPFILIRAKPEATVEVSVSETLKEVDFKFSGPFSLNDDTYVLRQMAANLPRQMQAQEPSVSNVVPECAASS